MRKGNAVWLFGGGLGALDESCRKKKIKVAVPVLSL